MEQRQMNKLGLVLHLPQDQSFTRQLPDLLTNTTFVRSDAQNGPLLLFRSGRSPVAAIPWCEGIQVRFLVTFPMESHEQAMREWDASARKFAFHPAFAGLLWRQPYYHAELQTVGVPKSSKNFRKPWESGGFYFLTFSMHDESSSSLEQSVLAPYPRGEEMPLTVPPMYWPSHVEKALFDLWREFVSAFHLFLMEANLSQDDDRIPGDFDLASRRAAASAQALCHPLRMAREKRQLSMRELAESIGLVRNGQNRINEWEHGKHVPTLVFANALASQIGFESGAQERQVCQDWQREHLTEREDDRFESR
jgi:DNA-binding XRE family transcriptional regulator